MKKGVGYGACGFSEQENVAIVHAQAVDLKVAHTSRQDGLTGRLDSQHRRCR